MLDKDKFQNYFLHFLATEQISKIAKKYKKNELYQKLKSIKLETAKKDLHDLRDFLYLNLMDLRDLLGLRDLRDFLDLLDLRDLRDSLDLRNSRDLRDLRYLIDSKEYKAWKIKRVKKLIDAFEYAGGNKTALKDKKLYNKLVSNFEKGKLNLEQSTWLCGTTCCTAGGTVIELGLQELADIVSYPTAAAMASYSSVGEIPNYYEPSNKVALETMRRLSR